MPREKVKVISTPRKLGGLKRSTQSVVWFCSAWLLGQSASSSSLQTNSSTSTSSFLASTFSLTLSWVLPRLINKNKIIKNECSTYWSSNINYRPSHFFYVIVELLSYKCWDWMVIIGQRSSKNTFCANARTCVHCLIPGWWTFSTVKNLLCTLGAVARRALVGTLPYPWACQVYFPYFHSTYNGSSKKNCFFLVIIAK